jgi:hypothetical protein
MGFKRQGREQWLDGLGDSERLLSLQPSHGIMVCEQARHDCYRLEQFYDLPSLARRRLVSRVVESWGLLHHLAKPDHLGSRKTRRLRA